MRSISEIVLRAKHWQIFLVTVAFVIAAVSAMLLSFAMAPSGRFPSDIPFLAVMELFLVSFALWLWSLGIFLNSLVPRQLRMKTRFFGFSLIYLPLYLPAFGIFFEVPQLTRNVAVILISWAIIFPLHLFAIFCQFYSLYFVSKSMALAENRRPISFGDYVGYFFGLWIFPVGVWIIQPRINYLYTSVTRSSFIPSTD